MTALSLAESSVIPQLLLVDDDRDLLLSLRLQLEADGFRVLTAENGQRALAVAGEVLPHLAVIDLMMPGIDGFAVARRLRQYADVPVIMLTAIDDPARKIEGLTHYADDYVTKPFAYGELLVRIRERGTVEIDYRGHDVHITGRVAPALAGELRSAAERWEQAQAG